VSVRNQHSGGAWNGGGGSVEGTTVDDEALRMLMEANLTEIVAPHKVCRFGFHEICLNFDH